MWHVYIVECADNTLYTGYTDDVSGRIREHNFSKTGAKYTRSRRPIVLVYRRGFRDRAKAMKEEYRIKQLSRADKRELIVKRNTRSAKRVSRNAYEIPSWGGPVLSKVEGVARTRDGEGRTVRSL